MAKIKGSTKSIDLGKSSLKYSNTIRTDDPKTNRDIFNTLTKTKNFDYVDKYFGKLKLHIDSGELVRSESDANHAVYSLDATVQGIEEPALENTKAALQNEVEKIKEEIDSDIKKMASDDPLGKEELDRIDRIKEADTLLPEAKKNIGKIKNNAVDDKIEFKNNVLTNNKGVLDQVYGFVDNKLNIMGGFIDKMIAIKDETYTTYQGLNSRISTARRLIETLKSFKEFPDQVLNLVKKLIDNAKGLILDIALFFSDSNPSTSFSISRPKNAGNDNLSEFERKKIADEWISCFTINKIKLAYDINLLLSQENWQEDVLSSFTINILQRIDACGFTDDKVISYSQMIQNYKKEQESYSTYTIFLEDPIPLLALVYEYYESLDDYYLIERLNNFKDNDWVKGEVVLIE